jgi:hypothetical protein
MKPPSWSDLLKASQACPLVYLVPGQEAGHALVLDGTRNPAASAIPLPGFTTSAISLLLHGKPQADSEIEGLEYTMDRIVSPDAPSAGGLIPAYAAWQAGIGEERNAELWFPTARDCGCRKNCLSSRAGTFVESDHCRDEDWQGNGAAGRFRLTQNWGWGWGWGRGWGWSRGWGRGCS